MSVEHLRIDPLHTEGLLRAPAPGYGVVLFAHGSGSSRLSPRNNYVADALSEAGLGTFLFDLLTEEESLDRANVFDIALLAERLVAATDWLWTAQPALRRPIGYFGASTGAAAALMAAVQVDKPLAAIVSRGGRPDLAAPALSQVAAATLLIVGGHDHTVLALNEDALAQMTCEKELAVVPGATHLFEEEGALDEVVALARRWFLTHLAVPEEAQT
jgi:putative phosphoribosyl transferase